MSKNSNKVGFMCDVVMRRNEGKQVYLMLPGQAFPADPEYEGNKKIGVTQIWLYSAMMSKGKYYTDTNSAPKSLVELQSGGVYNVANTSEGFGLSVYTLDTLNKPGLFSESYWSNGDSSNCHDYNIWNSQLPIKKYHDLQNTALCVSPDSASVFLPRLYAKLKPGVKASPHRDVLLYDVVCEKKQWFRRADIPLILDDIVKAREYKRPWTNTDMARVCKAVKGFYFEANADVVQDGVLYIAYDAAATAAPDFCEKKYTRAEFDMERTFFGSTYRRYIEVPYIANDVLQPIDIGRTQARRMTLDVIARGSNEHDYINEI